MEKPFKVDETRVRVLNAAAKLFRHKGYAETTLREIAKECNLKAGSIYYHFGSKDEILEKVLEYGISQVWTEVQTAIQALPDKATSYEKVKVGVEAHLNTLVALDDFTATHIRVFKYAPEAIRERTQFLRDDYDNYWKQLLIEAQEQGALRADIDLSVSRLFLFGGINWTLEWYRDRKLTFAQLAEIYTDIFFKGIGKNS
ncbi:TetR/AcrR family transcriptional regulator [Deltaproteobacteria bacterium TL4]